MTWADRIVVAVATYITEASTQDSALSTATRPKRELSPQVWVDVQVKDRSPGYSRPARTIVSAK